MNTLKKIGNILIIVCALFYVVSFYSFTLAEESQAAKTSVATISDSFLLSETPLWLGSRIGFDKIIIVRSAGKTHLRVIEDSLAYKYLNEHNAQMNIDEVYPNGDNPLEMPSMVLSANIDSPLDLEATGVKKYMGNELINELVKTGKVRGKMLLEQLEFYPVIFSKIDNEFEVSKWLPKSFVIKLLIKKK